MQINIFRSKKKKDLQIEPPTPPAGSIYDTTPQFDSMRPDPFGPLNKDYEMMRRMKVLDQQADALENNQQQLGVSADDIISRLLPIIEKLKVLRNKQTEWLNKAESQRLITNYWIEMCENIVRYHSRERERLKALGGEIEQFQKTGIAGPPPAPPK